METLQTKSLSKVMLNLTTKLVKLVMTNYVMVKKTYLESLNIKKGGGLELGASAPFFLYKNMDDYKNILDLCYKTWNINWS